MRSETEYGDRREIPQKKAEQFSEEFLRARTPQEALKVLKRVENYFHLQGDLTVLPILVNGYRFLEDLEKAEHYNKIFLEVDKSGYALYYQGLIESQRGNVEKAINLFEKVLEMATDRELQLKAVAVELLNFVMSHDYENMEKVLKKRLKVNSPEELKRLILNFPENLANFLINVYHAYKRFYEAKDFFNQGRGRELLEAIKKELKDGGISYSRITYEIDWDYEEPVKLPLIYVRLTREYPQELLRKINKKLVEEFFFKKGLNFMLLFQGG